MQQNQQRRDLLKEAMSSPKIDHREMSGGAAKQGRRTARNSCAWTIAATALTCTPLPSCCTCPVRRDGRLLAGVCPSQHSSSSLHSEATAPIPDLSCVHSKGKWGDLSSPGAVSPFGGDRA